MKKFYFLLVAAFIFHLNLSAQSSCDPPLVTCPCEVTPICGLACLDNYQIDMSTVPPQNPPTDIPGCGGVVNNPSWFAFVAGGTTLTIEIVPSNCTTVPGGNGPISGIQAALYGLQSTVPEGDCGPNNTGCDPLDQDFSVLATSCGCAATPSNITFAGVQTVPGQTYYIIIDGCGGSACIVDINILMGGEPPVVNEPGAVLLPPVGFDGDTICPGATDYNISLDPVDGAGFYRWSIVTPSGDVETLTVDPELFFTFPGGPASYGQEFDFCVKAFNDCDSSDTETCFTLVVAPLDTLYDPDIILCEGSTTVWRGMTVGPSGSITSNTTDFVTIFQNDQALFNCEFVAAANVIYINENDESPTEVDTILCEGDLVEVFNMTYSGAYMDEIIQGLTSPRMCDTFVELTVVNLNASATYNTNPPTECTFPGMFQFSPNILDLEPLASDPNLELLFEVFREDDGVMVYSGASADIAFGLDDFNNNLQIFEIYITMTYTLGTQVKACQFGPFNLVVNLINYIPSDPIINGPDTVCDGSQVVYTVTESMPAFADPTQYVWDLGGMPNAALVDQFQNTATIQFNGEQTGQICVRARNDCFFADTCFDVAVISGPIAGPDDVSCALNYTFAGQAIGGVSTWSVISRPSMTASAVFVDANDPTTTVNVSEAGTYTFEWGLSADCVDEINITFVDSMRLDGAESYICDNTNTNYTIEFDITGGIPPYTVSGASPDSGTISGNMFTSDPIPNNVAFTVILEDSVGCMSEFAFMARECTCDTEVGAVDTVLVQLCGEADSCWTAVVTLDPIKDGNDTTEFILHTQPGSSISTIIDRNHTGEFCFIPGTMMRDVTYYISIVVGDSLSGGQVDLTEGCTRVSPGTPIVWQTIPTADAVDNLATCEDTISLEANPSIGVGTWSVIVGPGTATFDDINDPNTMVSVTDCGIYTFEWREDNDGCADSVAIDVEFYCNPTVRAVFQPCNGTQDAINLRIELENGTEPYTEDFGRGTITGSTFTIDGLPLLTPDTFYFTDGNGCMLTVPVDVGDCSCITESGEMDANQASDCQDQTITVTHDATNVVQDDNDMIQFIAHTRMDDTLGTIIAVSNTTTFAFTDGPFVCDVEYYVSAVGGNWTGSEVDLNDPCLNVSVGQPIRFDCAVTVDAGLDFDTCDLTLNLVATSSTGNGVWTAVSPGTSVSPVGPLTGAAVLPGAGDHTFTFTGTNGGCEDSDDVVITVPEGPTIIPGTFLIECSPDNETYTVTLRVTGGDALTYMVDGLGSINIGGFFTSDPIDSGDPFDFEFFDQFDCIRADTAGSFECPCVSAVGSLTPEVLNLCEEETFDASTFYSDAGQMTDANDVINYILSDNPADPTNPIIDANTDGIFRFNNNLTFGTTYYVSVIIGSQTSPTTVDINDPCLAQTSTLSVTWYDRIDMFDIASTATEITCDLSQITLSINTGEDLTGYDIRWTATNGGNIEPGDENMPTARVNSAGTYTLTISHPLAGCAETDMIVITQSADVPVVMIGEPLALTCDRDQVMISGAGSSVGPNITYEWTGPGIVGTDEEIDVLVREPGVYILTIRDASNGCEIPGNVTVIEDREDPAISVNALERIDCDTDVVTVSGAGSAEGANITYQWTASPGGNILSGTDQRDIQVDAPGDYELLVVNTENGCESRQTATVTQEENIISDFDLDIKPPGCADVADGMITVVDIVGGVPPYSYSFDNGMTFVSNPSAGQFGPGTFSVIVRDNNNCEDVDTAILPAPFDFFVDIGEDQNVLLGESVSVTATTNLPDSLTGFIRWSPLFDTTNQGTLNQEFTPAAGQYILTLTVSNTNGCEQSDQIGIFVRFEERVYIPNAMHTNGLATDNRFLNIYADPSSVASLGKFEVFDRWGNRTFQRPEVPVSLDLQEDFAWNGTYKGQDAAPGVYTYFVEVEYVTGFREVLSGEITLLR